METVAKIRRHHFVLGKGIKRTARDLSVSKNTVKKAIREGVEAFSYKRQSQPRPRLAPHIKELNEVLVEDWKQPRKMRLTAKRIYEDLVRNGYLGAYDSVRRFVKDWREKEGNNPSNIFVPLRFEPGEAYQFDWSHEKVLLGGVVTKIKLAHFRLSYSRKPFVMAFTRESLEMLLEAHNRAFAFFGGACRKGVYDNMRTVVTRIKKGKDREFHSDFSKMCDHFLVEPIACSPASGWEKGQVENQVRNIRRWFFIPMPSFADLEELNCWLVDRCIEIAGKRPHPEEKTATIEEMFLREQGSLIAYPGPFDACKQADCRVSSTSLIRYEDNHYSVDCLTRGVGTVKAYPNRIKVIYDGKIVAEHPRHFGKGKTVYNPWHYLKVLERKPGAIRNGAPFYEWDLPAGIAEIRKRLEGRLGGDRDFVSLLLAAKEYGLDPTNSACVMALKDGTIHVDAILNHISRLCQSAEAAPIEPPVSLQLKEDPVADCSRYDQLLENKP
ncbi:MAG: IS21 family transposase [Magnetococcales bacterium]|nr:IS21 family transposase [Magnetococcales bacterium]